MGFTNKPQLVYKTLKKDCLKTKGKKYGNIYCARPYFSQ